MMNPYSTRSMMVAIHRLAAKAKWFAAITLLALAACGGGGSSQETSGTNSSDITAAPSSVNEIEVADESTMPSVETVLPEQPIVTVLEPVTEPPNPVPPIVTPPIGSGTLPVLDITTTNSAPIDSKDIYVPGTYTLVDSTGSTTLASGALEIRGRGNFTWTLPKKPFRLKLENSASLLSMPANRHWVLLANYLDKTHLRTELGFELSRQIGMEYTPRTKFVEVRLNGTYQGLYQLAEHIRIGADRVNIPELKATDLTGTNLTGGYLIEIDWRRGEAYCFDSLKVTPLTFCLNTPSNLLDTARLAQKDYITNYIHQFEDALMGPNYLDPASGWRSMFEMETAVHYYIVQELLKNPDGALKSSTFLIKRRSGGLAFGPFWDFDIVAGHDGPNTYTGWHIRNAPWFTRMFEDPVFAGRVKTRWNELKTAGVFSNLDMFISQRASNISSAHSMDQTIWPALTGSHIDEVNALRLWISNRVTWMDAQINATP